MRSGRLLLVTLLALASSSASAQLASREYRPQLQIGTSYWHGIAATVSLEHRYAANDLQRTEVYQGIALSTKAVARTSAAFELRQVRRIDGSLERRFVPTVTVAAPMTRGIQVRERARVEVREIEGSWSRRWQERTTLERAVRGGSPALMPYAFVDLSYDSRYGELNRRQVGAGVRIPLAHGTNVDPYLTHQWDGRRDPMGLIAFGMIVRVSTSGR
jgi:hypothetical protein